MKEKIFKILNCYVMPLFLIAIGVFILTMGISNTQKAQSYEKTTAEIIDITSEYDSASESIDYKTFVRYTVGGREYSGVIDTYVSSYRIGGSAEILYDPSNPVDIIASDELLLYLPFAISAVTLILGIVFLVRNARKDISYKREHEYDM